MYIIFYGKRYKNKSNYQLLQFPRFINKIRDSVTKTQVSWRWYSFMIMQLGRRKELQIKNNLFLCNPCKHPWRIIVAWNLIHQKKRIHIMHKIIIFHHVKCILVHCYGFSKQMLTFNYQPDNHLVLSSIFFPSDSLYGKYQASSIYNTLYMIFMYDVLFLLCALI